MKSRAQSSREIRLAAAELAYHRLHPQHVANGEETAYRDAQNQPTYIANFTKGLPHNEEGLLEDPKDYEAFIRAIDSGDLVEIEKLRLGPGPFDLFGRNTQFVDGKPVHAWFDSNNRCNQIEVRAWESQSAGRTFDLEGPDAQAVTMPPAPRLDSKELVAEIAENYWMALLRDVPFDQYNTDTSIQEAQKFLGQLAWFRPGGDEELTSYDLKEDALDRRRQIANCTSQSIPLDKLFRGLTPGEDQGPYVSQFMLIGNTGLGDSQNIADGQISYGSIRIDQRVRFATPKRDYMQDWHQWLDVQNGADLRDREEYEDGYRFITTPRDLATYVHYDQLYEAYLNACLLLLEMRAPFDPGLPFQNDDFRDKQQAFATFGGPHILSLVTEVATRALKAVRFQKFNIHRRLRPEGVGGLLHQWLAQAQPEFSVMKNLEKDFNAASEKLTPKVDLLNKVKAHNKGTWLLPMAFPEGSPMHPSYGAGHGTVAGACTTILKAFFDSGWELVDTKGKSFAFEADSATQGKCLKPVTHSAPLTVEGELNKLASNISIGRNWAGVHYFSDHYESIRLGEQIAIGILEEQKLTYGENFSMTIPLFDGGSVRI